MNDSKVSIILPVYNGEKIVGKSIESILNQTYVNFELIIVNDCSTDNTLGVISKYAKIDNRIKIINNKKNLKLPNALNAGFDKATGSYLTWTSDDNIYHFDAIEKMVEILDNYNNIGLVFSAYTVMDFNDKVINIVEYVNPSDIRFYSNIGACFLYRASLSKKIGKYNPDFFLAEDYDYFIRLYKESNGNFFFLKDNLYDYYLHASSLTSTKHNEVLKVTYMVMMAHFEYLYSICITDNDKFRLFDSILGCLKNENKNLINEHICKFNKLNSKYRYHLCRKCLKKIILYPLILLRKLLKG